MKHLPLLLISLLFSLLAIGQNRVGSFFVQESQGSYLFFPQFFNPAAMNASDLKISATAVSDFSHYNQGQLAIELPSYKSRLALGMGYSGTLHDSKSGYGSYLRKEQGYLNFTLPIKIKDGILSIGARPFYAYYEEGFNLYEPHLISPHSDIFYPQDYIEEEINMDLGIYWKTENAFVGASLSRIFDNERSKELQAAGHRAYLEQRNLYITTGFFASTFNGKWKPGASLMFSSRGGSSNYTLHFNNRLFDHFLIGIGGGASLDDYFYDPISRDLWLTGYLGYEGDRIQVLLNGDYEPNKPYYHDEFYLLTSLQLSYRFLKTVSKKAVTLAKN
ncbi:type IX secretion system membrane protein PorP/SprF [bacterium SCSIO 12741]|nr:type IX secretion system membrane protein PorP/SprF [bacterium SCSIO 12741]